MLKNFLIRHFDALIAAIIGFFVLSLFTKYGGIGISPDSVMYISGARNIYAHQVFFYFGHQALVAFPLFYPTFLSTILFITGIDPVIIGPTLNGLLFALLIFLSGIVMERFIFPSKWYKWFILLAIALSPSLLEIYSMLWSETLFMVWTLVFMIAYKRYMSTHSLRSLMLVAGITALACVTRYAGVTLIGAGGLLLLFDLNLNIRKKIGHILIFGLISISLLVTNLVRNSLVTHTGTGPRYKSLTSLYDNMHYAGTVLCDWLTLTEQQYGLAFTITLLTVLAFIIAFLLNTFRNRARYFTYEQIALAFFIVYALFMIISATISRYERINNRLLSPMFIPFLLGCTYWIPLAIREQASKVRIFATVIAAVLALGFLYGEIKNDTQRYDDQGDYGVPGYTDDSWNKSDLIKLLKRNPGMFKQGYPIYNNACEAFYFFTGKGSAYIPKPTDVKRMQSFDAQPHGYIVIFDQLPDPTLLPLQKILLYKPLKQLYKFADGGVYMW